MARSIAKKQSKVQKVVKRAKKQKKAQVTSTSSAPTIELPKGKYIEGVGRRKVATARVRIYETPGDFIVNGMAAGQYFDEVVLSPSTYNKPLELTGMKGKFTISAKVSGSGVSSQLDAVVHGLARALVKYNADFRPVLKEAGLLTRDDRMKETRKIGTGGKARRKRQSPKR